MFCTVLKSSQVDILRTRKLKAVQCMVPAIPERTFCFNDVIPSLKVAHVFQQRPCHHRKKQMGVDKILFVVRAHFCQAPCATSVFFFNFLM